MTLSRIRPQDGFGLIELLIAMTILTVGIMGIVAAFSAGAVSLQRASRASTAGAVADAQMESYRALQYAGIKLDASSIPAAADAPPYTTDPAFSTSQIVGGSPPCAAPDVRADPECARRTTTGADGRNYLVDVYITETCPLGGTPPCSGSRPAKLVTLVVRDGVDTAKVLVRQASTFDEATG